MAAASYSARAALQAGEKNLPASAKTRITRDLKKKQTEGQMVTFFLVPKYISRTKP